MAYGRQYTKRRRHGEPRRMDFRVLRARVFKRDDFTCQGCGWRPREIPDPYDGRGTVYGRKGSVTWLELDHVEHHATGGSDGEANLRTLCNSCNTRRGSR